MKRTDFAKLLQKRIVVLDGSSGVALQQRGIPKGVCPEQWAIDNEHHLVALQKDYVAAGSDILFTFSFGGNPVKLGEFGLKEKAFEINKKLAEISRKACGKHTLVAGDIAPTGHFPEPFGEMKFEDTVDIFKEQVKGLLAGGVDLFVIETMMDIQEARAALLAVKETCDLPVMVSMTFDRDKKTLTGTDPLAALVTLEALGADAFGVNCSTGPAEMVEVIKLIKPYASIPVLAKPNAGLPKLVGDKTVFEMQAQEFCTFAPAFVQAGVNLIGGCCGTSPEYIKLTVQQVKNLKPILSKNKNIASVSSPRIAVFPGTTKEAIIVGERINPTGKKQLQAELLEGKEAEIRRFASEQEEKGASILDVNMGMPGIDEKASMLKTIKLLSTVSRLPLAIDSSSPEVIEAALRLYPGKALINSISGEEKKKKVLALAAKYGAMFILLPLDDKGIPATADGRMKVVNKVLSEAKKLGIGNHCVTVDGLVMTVSANQDAAKETLKVIEKCTKLVKVNTICGLSNVSFGLPERAIINSTFFNMAREKGLSMVIANPSADLTLRDPLAEAVLTGKDLNAGVFIQKYGVKAATGTRDSGSAKTSDRDIESQISEAVLKGMREIIGGLIQKALSDNKAPNHIVDNILIPAINEVGVKFDKKEYFLPQLIQSAETMKEAFKLLEPLLAKKSTVDSRQSTVVLATVKGDIHDIGKNIVGLMLKNYGFNVIDLGKDVPSEAIVKKAKETGAGIIGLSALMTTTMTEMRVVTELAKKEGLSSKVMIGGAVVNQAYADEIGASYSKDAYEAVKLAQRLTTK